MVKMTINGKKPEIFLKFFREYGVPPLGLCPTPHEGSALDPLRELFEKSSLKTFKNF